MARQEEVDERERPLLFEEDVGLDVGDLCSLMLQLFMFMSQTRFQRSYLNTDNAKDGDEEGYVSLVFVVVDCVHQRSFVYWSEC